MTNTPFESGTKIIPSSARFYLAEDIRQESDGKQSLLGLYADDRITLGLNPGVPEPSLSEPAMFEGFAILCVLDQAFGQYTLDVRMTSPSGATIVHQRGGGVAAKIVGTLSFGAKFKPFPVSEFGEYTYTVTVDGTEYEYKFKVAKADTPSSEAFGHIRFESIAPLPALKNEDSDGDQAEAT